MLVEELLERDEAESSMVAGAVLARREVNVRDFSEFLEMRPDALLVRRSAEMTDEQAVLIGYQLLRCLRRLDLCVSSAGALEFHVSSARPLDFSVGTAGALDLDRLFGYLQSSSVRLGELELHSHGHGLRGRKLSPGLR